MLEVLFNTLIYLLIIGLGYFLKKVHVLEKEAGDMLGKLVVNLTLPAMLLSASNGLVMNYSIFVYLILGVAANIIMLITALILTRKERPVVRSAAGLSCAGIDIGDFVLPFVLKFFPGQGVLILNTFNMGNTIMNNGGNYAIASKVAAGDEKFGFVDIIKKLFSSVTFDTYILIIIMACTGWSLPQQVMQFVNIIGNANIFIVMLMIGLKLEFKGGEADEESKTVKIIFFARLIGAAVLSGITWLLPLPVIGKLIATLSYFGPPSSVANAYARRLGYKGGLVAKLNVFCIFPAIFIITGIIMAAKYFGM